MSLNLLGSRVARQNLYASWIPLDFVGTSVEDGGFALRAKDLGIQDVCDAYGQPHAHDQDGEVDRLLCRSGSLFANRELTPRNPASV